MNFYVEINLLPNEDVPLYFIWSKVFIQIHLALVEVQDENGNCSIGVSFPSYSYNQLIPATINATLGKNIRLFAASKAELEILNLIKWLSRLKDYLHLSAIQVVPENVKAHALVSRYRTPQTLGAMVRRLAKRKCITEHEAELYFLDYKRDFSYTPPFIEIKSLSGQNKQFRLFIQQKIVELSTHGKFNTYGMSNTATVPIW